MLAYIIYKYYRPTVLLSYDFPNIIDYYIILLYPPVFEGSVFKIYITSIKIIKCGEILKYLINCLPVFVFTDFMLQR